MSFLIRRGPRAIALNGFAQAFIVVDVMHVFRATALGQASLSAFQR